MSLRIHNTLTRRLEAFVPIDPAQVRMYVCGITVYDRCHLGHARMALSFDTVFRWLLASGYSVRYVRNITDIDDKIIARAVQRGLGIRELTDEMIAAMHADFGALGLLAPTDEPRATDFVPQMLTLIGRLQARGLAYAASSGDMNFAVRKFDGYGKLSGKTLDDLRAGERVAVQGDKQDPLDFVLWKAAKADEPPAARWSSPFGDGRPGWHIECSAMAEGLLGAPFDIHGGGMDLQFPHHENEIAQSEGASGGEFARTWMHNGFLNVDDTKMSKSLGNFFTIADVLRQHDGETLRLFMLRTHYRSPFNFSDQVLEETRTALTRLYTALLSVPPATAAGMPASLAIDWHEPTCASFKAAMDDDFNTPAALAVLFDLAARANRGEVGAASLLRALGKTLGLLQQDPQAFLQGRSGSGGAVDTGADAAVEALIAERTAAKAARDFSRADAIRQKLLLQGVALKDGPQGTTWVRSTR